MAEPPISVTSPPHFAEPRTLLLMGRVDTTGGVCVRRPFAPLAWKSLWLALVSFVARTQYQ